VRRCRRCGKAVRGQHLEVAEDQQGATAHRLGPRVKALRHVLHYQHGVPVRKAPAVIEEMTGVRLTQSALTQDALKQTAGPLGTAYRQLRETIGKADVVHTDDTGWRVGGQTAFQMVFATQTETVYQIRERHRNEEVREVISTEFAGVMVCDRGRSYDAEQLRGVAQQKCFAHLIRNAGEIADGKKGRAKEFGQNLIELLLLEIAEGATILISSHDIAEIETIASHIGISIAPPNPVFRGGSLTRLTRNVLAQDTSGRTL
jgi:transposase